jgi:uncharacterized protein YfaS (alpha-2-macroglobulin family)
MIDTHITMKIGQNGEAFFFVNDLAGNPASDMQITARVNDFISHTVNYDGGSRTMRLLSPIGKTVLSEPISLGKTGADGILRVDLRKKIQDAFGRTFENTYEFDENGKYPSFFVTAEKGNSLSYISSVWNSGIAPWNFGYQVNSWYDSSGVNTDNLTLSQWSPPEWYYNGHIFTDRVLYLPGESVMIKGVLRRHNDLSIPDNEQFVVIVTDPEGKERERREVTANAYGSIIHTMTLPKETPLGSYAVILADKEGREISRTWMTVEVFKNPKFRTEIQLETQGLQDGAVTITDTGRKQMYGWYDTVYSGKFAITAHLIGRYYHGGVLAGAPFEYKVYRQEFFDTQYWSDCYYGCFWEPQKEFYTEGSGTFDAGGGASLTIPVDFASAYSDYRYIVEVTPRDAAGDTVSSTGSIIARLPEEYKIWNPNSSITFSTEKRFVPAGSQVKLTGKLNYGTWSDHHENKFLLIVKKKTYDTKMVQDVRGYERPISTPRETLVDILPVSSERFQRWADGSISLDYTLPDTAEYIIQFGKIQTELLRSAGIGLSDLIAAFRASDGAPITRQTTVPIDATTDLWTLSSRCIGDDTVCTREAMLHTLGCDIMSNEVCLQAGHHTLDLTQRWTLDDLLVGRQFLSLLTYSDAEAQHPQISDNKVQVLSEKVSYKLGEKARILVRLPFSKGKILWTVEKDGIEMSELIDVTGNLFFREVTVDESWAPNAYIGVVAIDTATDRVPTYKVGYTEIVIDKTDKKSTVAVQTDKEIYSPRETVTVDITLNGGTPQKKSEVALLVVDDSLISLMGNIDMNTLEKIWIKLPFQIQTSLTNIAMLRNVYFARPGIVGGSGALDQKGGDSTESTRTIFKNTAYYHPRLITDTHGRVRATFTLPDNLTQFRVMAITNGSDNTFGAGETTLTVKKPVIVEDKTPLILREGDTVTIGANVFNQSGKDDDFIVSLESSALTAAPLPQTLSIRHGANTFVTWRVTAKEGTGDIDYTITAKSLTTKKSDSLSRAIKRVSVPTLINRVSQEHLLTKTQDTYTTTIPANTLTERSTYEITLSKNPLIHLERIISSLLVYPYGCIEQTTSTTVPNMLALGLADIFWDTRVDRAAAEKSLRDGLARIQKMQTHDGGFTYWEGGSTSDVHITPYVTRSLIAIQQAGHAVDPGMIGRALDFVTQSLTPDQDITAKIEGYYTLALAGRSKGLYETLLSPANLSWLSRHDRITLAYALLLTDRAKYTKEIQNTIQTLQTSFMTSNTYDYSWYWDIHADKALFTSLLMAYDGDRETVMRFVQELSTLDLDGYFMSTQSKNRVFMTFLEFMKKYRDTKPTTVELRLGTTVKKITLDNTTLYRTTLPLASVQKDGTIIATVSNPDAARIFVSTRLESYPAGITRIQPYSHGIQLTRTLYEVIDTAKLAQCSTIWSEEEKKTQHCDSAFKKVTGTELKRWATYKVQLHVRMSEKHNRNLTIEDYLPATMRVLQSQFRTDSIATGQSTMWWYFDRIEVRPDVVMAHASSIWENEALYEYFVIPESSGTFVYPPATAYLMYHPDMRAYGTFERWSVQ